MTAETLNAIEELVAKAVSEKWKVIVVENASRQATFSAITTRLPKGKRIFTLRDYFVMEERGIALHDYEELEKPLWADRIILCGAAAAVNEVAATLFVSKNQQLEIIAGACSTGICRKEIMRQRRRNGQDLTTGFQIKQQL